MITDRCNASCAFCGLSCSPKNHRVMSWELAKNLLDQAARLGFQRVSLSGGEPLLYPELVIQILSYARELGIPERTIASASSRSSCSARSRNPGCRQSSQSKKVTYSPAAAARPTFRAEEAPP